MQLTAAAHDRHAATWRAEGSSTFGVACPMRTPIAATHPPFAATVTARRGRQSRSTYRGNDLRNGSGHARSATRIVARLIARSRVRRAACDSLRELSESV